ncbi:MAG: hypothetical protein IH933_04285 [Euryarchaeota archaeon]|nr:hypothetical protein [Euryarchaeota archaeon]
MFWKPHWLHANYDMKVLALPPYAKGCYDDPSWGLNPDATYDCDWERGYIKKMIWSGMKDKWPAAYRLLQNYTLTNDDQNPMMKAIDVDGRDLVEVVQEWLDENEARWKPWVKDALM